ncbi:UvrD-helicase domain-containing protein [Gordonia sp. 852002-10350_SCH5691597]|uniref:UvrD-helicase domain-containing protein n=1 Tax=Gordonia sp. 852002-10350_SCH5691597 TaxID=1834085 RepID=UPI0007EA276D|nr:UvrD-helicase domain-containing protein [Gordonia sp. 852002-10350_SCH5691597]OBA72836.1 DNA helicase UvrD [Gordonia sp. 852002-10350_SCH5691597]
MTRYVQMHEMFQDSYDKLDGSIKGKVLNFMVKLQQDPDATGLDFKKPKGAANKYIRTARVNDNYRAVLVDPGGDSSLYLISVLTHDDAYDFAGKVTLQVNKKTGAAELFDHVALEEAIGKAQAPATGSDAPFMPSTVKPIDLERFGVEADLAEKLTKVVGEKAFLAIAEALPNTQANAVLDLAFGKSPDEVWSSYAIDEPGPVDPDDIQKALKRPISQLNFTAAAGENEAELRAVLEGDFAKWRVWLHPLQRKLATHDGWNGPFRVTGGAGTGKTVTALHRARHLAHRLGEENSGAKVLLTTYTRNLVRAIEAQLVELAGKEITQRVEVLNVDALARKVVASTDTGRALVTSSTLVHDGDSRVTQLWSVAAQQSNEGWEPAFLSDEWSLVVLGNSIENETAYLRVARSGRSQRLSRPQRADVWKVIEHFQRLMRADGLITFTELAARAASVLTADPKLRDKFGYRFAIIDEAQDLHPAHWKMVRALVKPDTDDLFIVGDAHQRIYGRPAPLSRYGIETRGRSRRLTINYRTSREILWWTLQVADPDVDDLDVDSENLQGSRSVFGGPAPEIAGFSNVTAENLGIAAFIRKWEDDGLGASDIAVFTYEKRHVDDIVHALAADGIKATAVGSNTAEEKLGDTVRVMTMHRAKGLEYRGVVLARLGEDDFPPAYIARKKGDDLERELKKLRSVLYVAGSRARERMAVTYVGEPARILT